MGEKAGMDLLSRLKHLTGLLNPKSPCQMKAWLSANGQKTDSLTKKETAKLLASSTGAVKEALMLYGQVQKSSLAKYGAMIDTVCDDGRTRGMFRFYGAARSGRWAGRHIQLQNLPRNSLEDLDLARTLVMEGDYEKMDFLYGSVPDTLSQLYAPPLWQGKAIPSLFPTSHPSKPESWPTWQGKNGESILLQQTRISTPSLPRECSVSPW